MRHPAALPLMSAAALSLLLAACGEPLRDREARGDLKTLARLNCPEQEDDLQLSVAAPDGLSCTYADRNGSEVRLQLVSLAGQSPEAVLNPFEIELQALMPPRRSEPEIVEPLDTAVDAATGEPTDALSTAADPADAVNPDLDVDADVDVGVEQDGETAHVRLPGLTIDADEGSAKIRIGNVITIDANDEDSVVKIRGDDSDVTIDADEEGAEVRTRSDEDGEVRSSYVLASETPSEAGWRVVGYEARGPAAGPLVVAVVKARDRRSDDTFDAMKDLVRKNVGR